MCLVSRAWWRSCSSWRSSCLLWQWRLGSCQLCSLVQRSFWRSWRSLAECLRSNGPSWQLALQSLRRQRSHGELLHKRLHHCLSFSLRSAAGSQSVVTRQQTSHLSPTCQVRNWQVFNTALVQLWSRSLRLRRSRSWPQEDKGTSLSRPAGGYRIA